MRTLKKQSIEYTIHPAPSSVLNLKLGVIYEPRKADEFKGGFHGFSCVEVERGWFVVAGWTTKRTSTVFEGDNLGQAWAALATHLGMA